MKVLLHILEAVTMYLKLSILCMLSMLAVTGFGLLSVRTGYKHLMKRIKLIGKISGNHGINIKWIEQKLDHFDIKETRSWNMRYYEKLDLWRPNGPIYLYLNGEGQAEPYFLTSGMMYQLARETNGAIFLSEHRYYGKSLPVKRRHIEDMKYLSSRQALADNANLLKTIKKNIRFTNSKVIVVGGSYAGNLATWMRLVYPDLVDAAIASSSPVLAKRDFYEYLEVVSNDYEIYGTPGCLENIRSIFQRYDTLFRTDEGIKLLKKEENVCEAFDIAEPLNKQIFFYMKLLDFEKNAPEGPNNIMEHCLKLNETAAENCKSDCYDYSLQSIINDLSSNKDDFNWLYQVCTEFGYFQSTTSDKQPFTKNVPAEFYDKLCIALFGESFGQDKINDGVTKTNEMYGGLRPNVTNVVFVNGQLDPWSALGVVKDISYDSPAVYIPKSSHCTDLFPCEEDDPVELTEARLLIKRLIKKWIGVHNNSV